MMLGWVDMGVLLGQSVYGSNTHSKDRKSTRLNSSHLVISYAVFCLKKKNFTPTMVIDHHPAYGSYEGVSFLDLRDEYGATSTILTEYLQEAHVDVESKIATAVFYGI